MKNGDIVIINFDTIENLVSILEIKELFVKGDFLENKNLLIALERDTQKNYSTYYEDYSLRKRNKEIKIISSEGTIEDFSIKNKEHIQSVKEFFMKQKIELSWLEVFQLAEMSKKNPNHEDNFQKLEKLYKKYLPKDLPEDSSFLDF